MKLRIGGLVHVVALPLGEAVGVDGAGAVISHCVAVVVETLVGS